jgi:hypothetical protein
MVHRAADPLRRIVARPRRRIALARGGAPNEYAGLSHVRAVGLERARQRPLLPAFGKPK